MNWHSIKYRLWLTWILPLTISMYSESICVGQESGLQFLRNFTAQEYRAHPQNFDICSGADGMMYFANFAGVLQFDGYYWRLIPTGKTSRITTVATDNNGQVQSGAYGEMGFLKTGVKGELSFENYQLNKPGTRQLGKEVIATFCCPEGTLFISKESIVNVKTGKSWFPGEEIVSAFYLDGKCYVQLKNSGLVIFHDNTSTAVTGGKLFSGAFEVKSVLKMQSGKILIATSTQGLYCLDERGVQPFITEADVFFRAALVTCGIQLNNYGFAIGTIRNGIIVIDNNGRLLQIINKNAGLNDDYIHKLYYDRNGILWVAMNNGLAMMEIPSALNIFDEKSGLNGGVNAISRFKELLYIGTYKGLYSYNKQQRAFMSCPGIRTACWSLLPLGNEFLAGCTDGLFRINGNGATKIFDGFCLSLASDFKSKGDVYIGTPNGLFLLPASRNAARIGNINEEVKGLVNDGKGKIWGTMGSDKLFMYDPGNSKIIVFDSTRGLKETTGAAIAVVQNSVMALLRTGVYQYSETDKNFKRIQLTDSTNKFGDWYSLMASDIAGNLWVCSGDQKNLRRLVKKTGGYIMDQSDFLPVSDRVFTCVIPENKGITWFGGPDGLICFNPSIRTNTSRDFPVMIRKVSLLNDSVLFFGNTASLTKTTNEIPEIQYKNNTISFDFASTFFAAKGITLYQYKLEGFDDTWSDWMAINRKEYTNLSHGNYVFRVRAMNVYGKVSKETTWAFHILPPWYLLWWVFILYFLFAAGLFLVFVRIRSRQLVKEKRILEQKIEERTTEVTRQKEEIEHQSEELSHKNSELEKINTLVKSINSEINFNSLLQSLLEKMRMIRSIERSATLVFDESDQLFKYKAAYGWDFSLLKDIRLTAAQSEQIFLAGSQEIYEDIFLKTRMSDYNAIEGLAGIAAPKAMLVVVIKINERIEAYLILENMIREDAFDAKDFSFILHSKEHIISAFIKTKILEDLQTTLKNLNDTQDQLIQAEKLASLGQLTAGIAHEIQNPLNFVNNFSALSVELAVELREYVASVKEIIDADTFLDIEEVLGMIEGNVKKIGEHGKRASSIVKGMLQHSRGRSGEFEIVEINTMVEEYVNLAYHGMRAKDASFNTKITTSLDPDVGKVSVVPQDISQAILNVMNNACYAVSEKSRNSGVGFSPEIKVSTNRVDDNVEIHIRDNGTGIPQHVVEKIFNPFFTTKPTGQGTGLGLSLCFDIITQRHKGKLEVNTEEGLFTEFVITLPLNVEKK